MKIDGYSTRPIQKDMYRIVDPSGAPVGTIQRNKEAANRPGTGRWHAYGNVSSPTIRGVKHSETASGKYLPCSFKPPA